jgi:hypothetical protein
VRRGARLAAQVGDHRRHELGGEVVREVAEQLLGHAGLRDRHDHVGQDAGAGALDGDRVRQADEPHLGGGVVALAEVAEGRVGRGEDEAAVALLLHDRERRLADVEGGLEVDVDDRVEVLPGELEEALVAQEAGVVDDDVDLAEAVDGGLTTLAPPSAS